MKTKKQFWKGEIGVLNRNYTIIHATSENGRRIRILIDSDEMEKIYDFVRRLKEVENGRSENKNTER